MNEHDEYKHKGMLGALVFTTCSGRYAVVTLKASNYRLKIHGGKESNYEELGGEVYADNLLPIQATAYVMKAMGISHNEDVWCDVLEALTTYSVAKIEHFERRLKEL